ncbi:hypothetical protein [Rhizobium sp. MHM7A]|uniref:hypothetical protein n=1 Tax=Rhizobium sp. MHM7A TaxID=2583233 RepID=UPI001105C74F|nr:hypothetical protein [Rhizobium sp. MHM7A]TLX16264.1 hypothetical protein FFR93_02750 [Rhizobium sp. MHM7A]
MIKAVPLNSVAETTEIPFILLADGFILKEGFTSRKHGILRFLKTKSAGELLQPTGKQRHVIFSLAQPPKQAEIEQALNNPQASALPVFEVSPASGKFMHRASQVALGLGIVYLAGGLLVGAALPTGLRWVSQYYGGGAMTIEERQRAKKVIREFEIMKENVVDQRAKDFFKAIKGARTEK